MIAVDLALIIYVITGVLLTFSLFSVNGEAIARVPPWIGTILAFLIFGGFIYSVVSILYWMVT